MKRRRLAILLLALLSLFGCQRRPLEYIAGTGLRVIVKILWAVDAYPEGEKPSGVTLFFFRDGKYYMEHTTSNVDSCVVQLDPGHYKLYMITQSPEEFYKMEFDNLTNFDEAEVSVAQTTSKWYTRAADEELIDTPEYLAAGISDEFDVTAEQVEEYQRYDYSLRKRRRELGLDTKSDVSSDPVLTKAEEMVEYYTIRVPVYPKSVISQFWVRIYAAKADVLQAVRSSTSGMAKTFMLTRYGTASAEGTQFITQWSLTMDDESVRVGHIDGKISTFGLPNNESASAMRDSTLNVSALLIDNKTTADYVFNVGDRITEEAAPPGYRTLYRLVLGSVTDPAIDLPDMKTSGGGGFSAAVNDWDEEVNADIPI